MIENVFSTDYLQEFSDINSATYKEAEKEIVFKEFNADSINIIPISDIHLGHKCCNKEKLLEIIKFINRKPNTYTVLLGDQCECATKTSVGLGIYEEEMNVGEQLKWLYKALKPLADNGKILGICTGNHENRLAQFANIDPAQLLADKLDVPFLGWQGYLALKVNDRVYTVSAFHGAGGGTSKASKMNMSKKIKHIVNCDLYLSGHTHDKIQDEELKYEFDLETKKLVPARKHFVVCGSFLEYWNSYPEMKGLEPAITGSVLITLAGDKKEIKVYR